MDKLTQNFPDSVRQVDMDSLPADDEYSQWYWNNGPLPGWLQVGSLPKYRCPMIRFYEDYQCPMTQG